MMFSATMPDSIEMIAKEFMRDPVRIDITPEGGAAIGITHRLYVVKEEDKRNCLLTLLTEELGSTLVFVRRKIDAEWLYHILERRGHPVSRIHADRSQGRRVEALAGFRAGAAPHPRRDGHRRPRDRRAGHRARHQLRHPGERRRLRPPRRPHRARRRARDRVDDRHWQDLPMVRQIEEVLGEKIPRCSVPGIEPWEESERKPSRTRTRV